MPGPHRRYRPPYNPRNHVLGAREEARDKYRAGQPRSPLSLAPQTRRSTSAPAPRQTPAPQRPSAPPPPAPQPPIERQSAPAQASPSEKEETDFAIKAAAKELKRDPDLKRDELYDLLFGSKDKRAPSLKKKVWVTAWTFSRFKHK